MLSTASLAAGDDGGSTTASWIQGLIAALLGGLLVSLSNIFSARSNRKSSKEADQRRAASDLALAQVKARSDLDLAQAKASSDEQLALNASGRDAALKVAQAAYRVWTQMGDSALQRRIQLNDSVIALQLYCAGPIVKAGMDLAASAQVHGQSTDNETMREHDQTFNRLNNTYLNAIRTVYNLGDMPPFVPVRVTND